MKSLKIQQFESFKYTSLACCKPITIGIPLLDVFLQSVDICKPSYQCSFLINVYHLPLIMYRTTANGNCLFNACSIALVEDESLALHLRSLSCVEMFVHSDFYADHPLLHGHFLKFRELNESSVF